MSTTAVGRAAEQYVADQLIQADHKIIGRNIRSRFYELDIIAVNKTSVHFVEVKYRRDNYAGGGLESITADKLRRLSRAAETWLAENQAYASYDISIDLASVSNHGGSYRLEYIENITG